ncbi:2-oxoglutarate ferredoxin oxidoreductase subunit delta [Dethiosulfatibacter aminovorans DSM 17477]|uniref:2-oxoglutarate ferredoxin oxidoreductase subunit delta n=1 Tax=Dethiosulfatibacter aminovorans DSM 17477 TaxID=1121476 RepID=A0A1M6B1V2_9FIRM|nr:4Fe-4S binding protein [Dethiosulfatibacter aminovorans]SHI42686.1 2-oxoglutarate ferredoxin oxidoreductase subunit delta [Dethiosulfatibacter aminovorans DSM 17477]
MKRLITNVESCKSCRYCEDNCPKDAIRVNGEINSKGYPTVVVDHEKCIVCGICYNVCPDYVFEIHEVEV